jgi:hypothetical protein
MKLKSHDPTLVTQNTSNENGLHKSGLPTPANVSGITTGD